MINATMVGEDALIGKLERMSPTLHQILVRRIWSLVLKVQRRVQKKLSGEVLNKRTGALQRSIQSDVEETAESVIGRIFSAGDVKYARIHEMGGTTRAHLIEPRTGDILSFMMGGNRVFARRVNHPGSKIPERSYMRSTLTEMKDEIVHTLSSGIAEAALEGRPE